MSESGHNSAHGNDIIVRLPVAPDLTNEEIEATRRHEVSPAQKKQLLAFPAHKSIRLTTPPLLLPFTLATQRNIEIWESAFQTVLGAQRSWMEAATASMNMGTAFMAAGMRGFGQSSGTTLIFQNEALESLSSIPNLMDLVTEKGEYTIASYLPVEEMQKDVPDLDQLQVAKIIVDAPQKEFSVYIGNRVGEGRRFDFKAEGESQFYIARIRDVKEFDRTVQHDSESRSNQGYVADFLGSIAQMRMIQSRHLQQRSKPVESRNLAPNPELKLVHSRKPSA